MTHLSDRINRLSEPQTIAMARKSRELIAQGIDIISLSLGEPDFKTPDAIKAAAHAAIDSDFSYYTHVSGYLELREAVAEKFRRDNGLNYTAEQIVVSTGAKQSIANVVLSMINPGDEVIIPMPFWVSYIELVKLADGIPVLLPTTIETNFKVTPEQVAAAITPKTRLFMFSTPCNPSGTVYTRDELRALAEVIARQPECYILSDEIYEHINFIGGHESMAQFDFIYDRTITINGVSKGFAMTGWRGGILAAPKWIAQACDKMQGQFTSATSSITQKAMHAAMQMDPASTHVMRDAFIRRRNLVVEGLSQIPGLQVNMPDGAFYVFPNVTAFFGKTDGNVTIHSGTDLCMYLLAKAHVAVVPGAAFGDDNYIRLSYATSDEKLVEAVRRMKEALAKLN
ncbi:MAG: pyridoxal phosphate-dependent aminotransferase [Bacteroidia bacterium]|jgi:aspartate aminotransferase|nr:pyridoxal phosphate-dependent aminotransferase [Bacteroidia bacterium]